MSVYNIFIMKKSLKKQNTLNYNNRISKKYKKNKNQKRSMNHFFNIYKGGKPTLPTIETTKDFWEEKIKQGIDDKWYKKAIEKWANKPASVSGVLDGYVSASEPDLQESRTFLEKLARVYGKNTDKQIINADRELRALDCGAGIGRISSGVLIEKFHYVDLVEPVSHFIDEAKKILGNLGHKGNFYEYSLQDFNTMEKYNCIWIQWVLGQLTDNDVIMFFKRCKSMLKPNGVIIVKENILSNGFAIDENYNLINRNYNDMKKLFDLAGLILICEENQKDFPSYLIKVNMFALE
jgi:protein N-terminal methyltransferase